MREGFLKIYSKISRTRNFSRKQIDNHAKDSFGRTIDLISGRVSIKIPDEEINQARNKYIPDMFKREVK